MVKSPPFGKAKTLFNPPIRGLTPPDPRPETEVRGGVPGVRYTVAASLARDSISSRTSSGIPNALASASR